MNKAFPPMFFSGCEVDPKGAYDVNLTGGRWVVRRCGVEIGYLPEMVVQGCGPLDAATTLIGYGVFVSKATYEAGPSRWASDSFPQLVDSEVAKL